jgi:hypothetical protein
MKLSLEIKGYIQDMCAKIFSWDKINTFGKRVGVDTKYIDEQHKSNPNFTKRKASSYIIEKLPEDTGEFVIQTIIEMAKSGTWDQDSSKKILSEINLILDRTMNCKVDEKGRTIPTFPFLLEESDLISVNLKTLGFEKGNSNYRDAFNTYKTSPKGSLGLLRTALEGVVEDVIKSKAITPTNNMTENISKLKDLGILNETPNGECSKCHYKKRDHELNYAYTLFGLLSHYGSHKELVSAETANFLFTSTSAFIWLLINRYKIVGVL